MGLSGKDLPGSEDLTVLAGLNKDGVVPDFEQFPNVFGWFWTLHPFSPPARALWGTTPAPAKAADDDFDLFGDETEEDKAATEALKKKSEAAPVKKEKKVIIAKSMVVFDIKGYEVEADWEAMATKVRLIEKDGLVWMDTHKVLPVAFGMKKLQMSMLIEDEKIETEDIFEIIESWEEDVQSTDIFTFNKA